MSKVRISTMLCLHLEAAGQYLGVPLGVVVKRPWFAANVKDELIIFSDVDLRGHVLFDPLVEADALQVKQVLVSVWLAHARADFV